MRFHCGFSFRLKDLRKFLIPFLLGILAYFGFSYFAYINVYALEDEEDPPVVESSDPPSYELPQDVYVVNDSPYLNGLGEYVFWFQEPNSSSDVLVNIYIIVFLYCVGMFTLKSITIIHNTKWRK